MMTSLMDDKKLMTGALIFIKKTVQLQDLRTPALKVCRVLLELIMVRKAGDTLDNSSV